LKNYPAGNAENLTAVPITAAHLKRIQQSLSGKAFEVGMNESDHIRDTV